MRGRETHPALLAGGEKYSGLSTVLLLSDDRECQSSVRKYAKSIGCKVYLSDRPFTDLIAVPCFIAFVDRRKLSEEDWLELLGIRRDEFLYRTWLVILDRKQWPVDRRCWRIRVDESTRIASAIQRELVFAYARFRIHGLVPCNLHYHTYRLSLWLCVARLFRRRLRWIPGKS